MISASEWRAYNEGVEEIAGGVERRVAEGIAAWSAENPGATVAEAREHAKALMAREVAASDALAASFAAEWYDYQAERGGARLDRAVTSTVYAPRKADEAARYQAKKLAAGDFEGFARACGEYARNDALRSLNATIMANVKRDGGKGVRFARVTTGRETCAFCLMLAGRGAVYHSRRTAGEFSHFHRRCDCKVVPGFEADPDAELVAGHSPALARAQELACRLVDEDVAAPRLTRRAVKLRAMEAQTAGGCVPPDECVPWLGLLDRYVVPDAKLESYALSYTGDHDKTDAFRLALGFAPRDAPEVIGQLYEWLDGNAPRFVYRDSYGERYETRMVMVGRDGQRASVIAGWIKRDGEDKISLTTIHVK